MRKGKDYAKTLRNTMGSPPYFDATPPRMGRTAKSGKEGNTFRIPNGAKYGLGEGKAPTRMDRSVPKGKAGSPFKLTASGPCRSSRSPTGGNSSMGRSYGVGGVSAPSRSGQYGGS